MKKFLIIILSVFAFIIQAKSVHAIVNPLSVPNNKYGIHLMNENGLQQADELVNSSGGDWGYVTIVIREDERDTTRWNRVFQDMERRHLIPLVRIATTMTPEGWTQGSLSEIKTWVIFLDSLNWPIANRYVIIGNEPNHTTEWHGEISPEEYTDYLVSFSKKLKEQNDRFFVLPAGLDASAPNDANHMDEETFLRRMIEHNAQVFDYVDGWNSHSYPNPAFMGSVDDDGRGSIKTYKWELNLLQKLGVKRDLPIFITETGWVHKTANETGLSEEDVSERLIKAYKDVWTDENIVAITPFILTFPGKPFGRFSWTDESGKPYKFYYGVQSLPKVAGKPIIREKRHLPIRTKNMLLAGIESYRQLISKTVFELLLS